MQAIVKGAEDYRQNPEAGRIQGCMNLRLGKWQRKRERSQSRNLSLNIIRNKPEEFGSSGRIRTGDLSINSRMLYR